MSALEGSATATRALPARALDAFRSPLLMVLVTAFVARTARAMATGGFLAPNGYDPGVYYAGAAGLVNGQLPYKDFSFVHPPGIVLLEAPFALLGRFTTDLTGYGAATVATVLLASFNAVLVVLVARAMGLPERAAVTGGLVYALWTNAVGFEYCIRLEPVGNFFLLCGLLAFQRAHDAHDDRRSARLRFVAGLALGATVAVKLWWLVPVAVFLGWHLIAGRRVRPLVPVVLGGATALVLVDLPFLLLTGSAMWDSIVLDQLGRDPNDITHHHIFSYLVAGSWASDRTLATQRVIIGVGVVLLAVIVRRAWRSRPARPLVAVLLAQCAMLWFQPIWFPFYSDFTNVALCLLVAAAFTPGARHSSRDSQPWIRRNVLPVLLTAGLVVNVTLFVATWETSAGGSPTPVPRTALARAVADVPCVASDQPMGLILVDALSRSFRNDCPEWVDVVGRKLRFNREVGPPSQRGAPSQWDRLVTNQLERSDVFLRTRRFVDLGLYPPSIKRLQSGGVVIDQGGYTIYRMPGRR